MTDPHTGTPRDNNRPFRCLVMDGGGMRGLYTACLLQQLRELCSPADRNPDFGASFDLLAGTSTGGLIAATLAHGCTLDEIIGIYKASGMEIFPHPLPDMPVKQMNAFAMSTWAVRFREKCAGDAEVLREILHKFVGKTTLRDVWEKRGIALAIAVTNVSERSGLIFKTPHEKGCAGRQGYCAAGDYPLVDVCLASAAAPVFFPLVRVPDPADPDNPASGIVCTDGGLWANSPVLPALLEAIKLHAGRPIEIIIAGSTGLAGDVDHAPGNECWGLTDWTRDAFLLELAMETQSQGYYQLTKALLPYLNIEPKPKIVRLPYTFPVADEVALFGLDKAHVKAQAVMEQRAHEDAARIYALAKEDQGELGMVLDFFGN